jgi:Mg2+-importing ATPase
LEALSRVDAAEVLAALGSSEHGLTAGAAEAALEKHGPNTLRLEDRKTILGEIAGRAKNPLNALLFTLAIVSAFIGDQRAAIVIIILMILLSVTLGFIQEHRSNQTAAKLRQHHKIYPHGRQLEFRQHVQRAWGEHISAIPAHAANPGADE